MSRSNGQVTQEQLELLCGIAEAAGAEIMAVYEAGGETWIKQDNSPLTEADLRADAVIRTKLEHAFPGLYIWSEESRSAGEDESETFFLVDPLDGTKEFLKRNGEFTVNIALIHHGVALAGVVFAPALDEMFHAAQGLGAWLRKGQEKCQLHAGPSDLANGLRVIGSRSHGGEQLAQWLATLKVPHTFVAAGSSLKFCRIAAGQADIYPRFGPTSQWDTAAGQCVLEVAGGSVTDFKGQALRYGLQRPVLNPEFLASGAFDCTMFRSGMNTHA